MYVHVYMYVCIYIITHIHIEEKKVREINKPLTQFEECLTEQ